MNYKAVRHIFFALVLMASGTIGAGSNDKKYTNTEMAIVALGGLAGGLATFITMDIFVDYYKKLTHEKRVQKIEDDLKKNEENNDAFSVGISREMLEQIKESKQFVGPKGKESIRYSKAELLRRIGLFDQANVKNKLSKITDDREAQKYIQSIPETIRVEVESDIQALNQRIQEANIKKSDEEVQQKLRALDTQFKHQHSASQSKLKDAIQGDFGQSITPITTFCKTAQYEIKQLESLLSMNISPAVKKDGQKEHDSLVALVRNTFVWLEPDIKQERIGQQEHEKRQSQVDAARFEKEYQEKSLRTLNEHREAMAKMEFTAHKAVTEVSSRALDGVNAVATQAKMIGDNVDKKLNEHKTAFFTRVDSLVQLQKENHQETQAKLTEMQRVNLSNADILHSMMATVERLEAGYRFDAQQRYGQPQAYAQPQYAYVQPQYQQPVSAEQMNASAPPMGL